jgi:hypothetical protein
MRPPIILGEQQDGTVKSPVVADSSLSPAFGPRKSQQSDLMVLNQPLEMGRLAFAGLHVGNGCLCGSGRISARLSSVPKEMALFEGSNVDIKSGKVAVSKKDKHGTSKEVMSGVLIGARLKGKPDGSDKSTGEVVGAVYFNGGSSITQITDPQTEELIDISDGGIVEGHIKKIDENQIAVETKDHRTMQIALKDVCSVHSPFSFLLRIPVKFDRSNQENQPFIADAGSVSFCKMAAAQTSISNQREIDERSRPKTMQYTAQQRMPSVLREIKQMLLASYNGEIRSSSTWFQPLKTARGGLGYGSRSAAAIRGKGATRLVSFSEENHQQQLNNEESAWNQNFLDWWKNEGTWLKRGSNARIVYLHEKGLPAAALDVERKKWGTVLGNVQNVLRGIDQLTGRYAAVVENALPAKFADSGTIISMCRSDGADFCTMRLKSDGGRYVNVNVPAKCQGLKCRVGSRVRIAGVETLPEWVNASPADITHMEGTRAGAITIQRAVAERKLGFALRGDGVDTANCRIMLVNESCLPMSIVIPKGQFFIPDKRSFQIMMITEDRVIELPGGMSYWVNIPTLCVSGKKANRPPPGGVCYLPACYPDARLGRLLPRFWEMAENLERCNVLQSLNISPSNRANKVAQAAIWNELSRSQHRVDEELSIKTVASDLGINFLASAEHTGESADSDSEYVLAAVDLVTSLSKQLVTQQGQSVGGKDRLNLLRAYGTGQRELPETRREPCVNCL